MLISNTPVQLGCCDRCTRGGMGETSNEPWLKSIFPFLPGDDWIHPAGTVALAAIAAFLAYKMLFGKRGTTRRKELAAARKRYQQDLSQIKERWAY